VSHDLIPALLPVGEGDRGPPGLHPVVSPDIHGNDDTLGAEPLSARDIRSAVLDGARVDAHLISAGPEDLLHVVDRPDAAADGEREEEFVCRPLDHVDDGAPAFLRCRDIEEDHLIRTLLVVAPGQLDGIARVAQADEVRAFDYPPVLEVQAGDDPLRQNHWVYGWEAVDDEGLVGGFLREEG